MLMYFDFVVGLMSVNDFDQWLLRSNGVGLELYCYLLFTSEQWKRLCSW